MHADKINGALQMVNSETHTKRKKDGHMQTDAGVDTLMKGGDKN